MELVDKGEEDKLLNDEEVYVNRVMETYCSAVASHNSYKKEIKLFEAADAQAALKIVLNVAKGAANEVISSEDEQIKKTVPSVKKRLEETFESFVAKALKLKAAAKEKGENEEKYKTLCDYTTEGEEVGKLTVQLEAVIISIKDERKPQSISVQASRSDSASSHIVKLQKMSSPHFSGNARDFGQFKRDFSAVVVVPGRSDVDIGYNLLNAVPSKYQHLINNIDKGCYN